MRVYYSDEREVLWWLWLSVDDSAIVEKLLTEGSADVDAT